MGIIVENDEKGIIELTYSIAGDVRPHQQTPGEDYGNQNVNSESVSGRIS